MTLADILNNLDAFSDEERKRYLTRLISGFSQFSFNEVMNFQNLWDSSRGYDAFRQEQNKLLTTCIELEMSFLGAAVRHTEGKPPWTLDTNIEETP